MNSKFFRSSHLKAAEIGKQQPSFQRNNIKETSVPKKTTIRDQITKLHQEIATGIDALESFDIRKPIIDDIKVGFYSDATYMVSLDVHVGNGVTVPLHGFIDHYRADVAIENMAARVVERVGRAWREREHLAAMLDELRGRASGIFDRARENGSPLRLLGTGLANSFLRKPEEFAGWVEPFQVSVIHERLSGADLRPEVSYLNGDDADAIETMIGQFLSSEAAEAARRAELQSIGAVGYADWMTIALIDSSAEPSESVLRRLACNEQVWIPRTIEGDDLEGSTITMRSGVAAWRGPVDARTRWDGDTIMIWDAGKAASEELVGTRLCDLLSHPFVDHDILITEVKAIGSGSQIELTRKLRPFDAQGRLLS